MNRRQRFPGLVCLSRVRILFTLAAWLAVQAAGASVAYAQGGVTTSSLSGTVADASGAVIPGADVRIKNNATAAEASAVTAENGTFDIPGLQPGVYTATVTLMGFKTAVVNNVTLVTGTPASIRVKLEVGGLEETVVVQGGSEIVQTQSATVSTTMNVNQISSLPLASRSVLDFVAFLPGVNTPGGTRDSTVNGLPQSSINITLDGMSIQDNHLKTGDGFFARVTPRLDAVEEMTVSTAANGADSSGQGAVQIRFTTRSGSNQYRGSAYYYFRHDALNANSWFNNRDLPADPATGKAPKPELIQHQPGFRIGGPLILPGLYNGRDKAFFFMNYEEFRQPQKVTRNRTILHPLAQQGIFRYNTSAGVREVNLFALAAANGQTATVDPTVARVLADISGAANSTGGISDLTDPSLQRYTFQVDQRSHNIYPTGRVDYNLTRNHRLTGSFNYQHIDSTPDTLNGREPMFPGFPVTGSQQSTRFSTSNSLRSTFGSNVVNDLRFGLTGGPTQFSPELNAGMWGGTSIADTTGLHLTLSSANITNAASGPTYQEREASTKVLEDTLTWVKGSHSLSFGGGLTQVDLYLINQSFVPTISFDLATGDPAASMFSAANFQGSSSTQRSDAEDLYALLTGRVSAISGNARIDENTNQYTFLGASNQRARMRQMDLFAQDAWRWRPNLTFNYGLRYVLQLPFYPLNDSYSTASLADVWGVSGVGNLFQPGVMPGRPPVFSNFAKGTHAYNTDWNNFAPSIGLAWTPKVESGFFRPLLGESGDTVLRAGYALAYERHGTSDFSGVFGANPGVAIDVSRNQSLGNLGPVPLLLRDRDRLAAPDFPLTPQYPMTEAITGDINIFDPNLQVPYAQTWTGGIQRKLTNDLALEVRYVGTRSLQGWTEYDYNEANIVENGFLDEFRHAQGNLAANIAAGRGATFRYFGAGTGTTPLPIYLAYFSGVSAAQANDPAKYTSSSFANSNFVNPLATFNPNPFTPAGTNANSGLDGSSARRANAAAAGLPANFFRANPDLLGGANVTGNGGYTKYNGLQIELRKRLSHGLQFGANYAFGRAYVSSRYSFRTPRVKTLDTGNEGGVTHALKANWVMELPFGRGRHFGANAGGVLDRIIGGWEFDGTARVQSGRMLDFGNVRLVGMTQAELQKAFKLRFDDANRVIYMLPQDIIDETVKAFSVSATSATGYGSLGAPSGRYIAPANGPDCIEVAPGFGDCGVRSLVVTGPRLVRFDLSAVKRTPITGRVNFEFRAEMLNALNTPWFSPVTGVGNDPDDYRVTSADSGREIQFVWRISW